MECNTPAHFRLERDFSFNFDLTQPPLALLGLHPAAICSAISWGPLTSRPIGRKVSPSILPNEIPKTIRTLLTLLSCRWLCEQAGTECAAEHFGEVIKNPKPLRSARDFGLVPETGIEPVRPFRGGGF